MMIMILIIILLDQFLPTSESQPKIKSLEPPIGDLPRISWSPFFKGFTLVRSQLGLCRQPFPGSGES